MTGQVATIPRIVHSVWVGDAPEPEAFARQRAAWADRARAAGEDWRFVHVTNDDLLWLPVSAFMDERGWPAVMVADVARVESVLAHGGVYLDLDIRLARSLAPLVGARTAWFAREPGRRGEQATNCAFAAPAGDVGLGSLLCFMAERVARTARAWRIRPPRPAELLDVVGARYWAATGGRLLESFGWEALSARAFCPVGWAELGKLRAEERAVALDALAAEAAPGVYGVHQFVATWKHGHDQ